MFRRCLDPYGRRIFTHVRFSYDFVPVVGLSTVLRGPCWPLPVKWYIIRSYLVNITRRCLHGPHRALYGPARLIIRIFPNPFMASARARTVPAQSYSQARMKSTGTLTCPHTNFTEPLRVRIRHLAILWPKNIQRTHRTPVFM